MTIGLGNRAVTWALDKGHISGTVKVEASASAVSREVILEISGMPRNSEVGL